MSAEAFRALAACVPAGAWRREGPAGRRSRSPGGRGFPGAGPSGHREEWSGRREPSGAGEVGRVARRTSSSSSTGPGSETLVGLLLWLFSIFLGGGVRGADLRKPLLTEKFPQVGLGEAGVV